MWLMIAPGVVALVGGIVLLTAPQRLVREQAPAPSWIHTDPFILRHRMSASIVLIAVGLFCLSSALYVWMRLHA
jgi:hypothetical protein